MLVVVHSGYAHSTTFTHISLLGVHSGSVQPHIKLPTYVTATIVL